MRTPLVLAAAALACTALTACGSQTALSSSRGVATTTTSASSAVPASSAAGPPPSATAPATTAASQSSATGCTTTGSLQASSFTRQILDVDGDGRPDTGFIARKDSTSTTIGVRTAAGGVFSTTFPSANTTSTHRGVLFADPTGTGRVVALTDDNRSSRVYVVQGCSLVPALSSEGTQYLFDLGYSGNGDGVSCATIAGRPSLVGFAYVSSDELRTAVDITVSGSGVTAANGAQDRVAAQDTTRVSCGWVTADGLELGG